MDLRKHYFLKGYFIAIYAAGSGMDDFSGKYIYLYMPQCGRIIATVMW